MIQDDEVINCEASPATEMDVFYLEWAKESIKRNLPFANESLGRLVTLNTSLVGGSIFLIADKALGGWFQAGAACFLLSLAASLLGSLPYLGASIRMICPEEIKAHKEQALRYKQCWLAGAITTLLIGLGCALIGAISK